MSEAERHLIAGPHRGSREQKGYDKTDGGRACDREEIPTGQKSEGTRDKANNDGADGTYSNSIRSTSRRSCRRRTAMHRLRA